MSFLAKLYINDRVINVLDCRISFTQNKDIAGKPAGRIHGGQIALTIEMDSHTDMLHQMMANHQMIDGYIRFFKRDGMSKMRDYEFKGTYVYRYKTTQTANGTHPALVAVGFAPGALRIGDVIYRKAWCDEEFDPFDQNNSTSTDMQENREFQKIHFETLEEQPLKHLLVGESIYIVVTSTAMGQQEADVDLTDYDVGFAYQGNPVVGNILKNISFAGNQKKIKVTVIPKENEYGKSI